MKIVHYQRYIQNIMQMTQKKIDVQKKRPYNSLINQGDSLINTLKAKNQEIQPKRQPLSKPTRDKTAENRSQSINTQDLSRRTSQSINRYNQINNVISSQDTNLQLQKYKLHFEVHQNQIKNLGKLLGNQNMSLDQMKNSLKTLLKKEQQINHLEQSKWKNESQSYENQISREYLRSFEGEILKKSKVLQQIASSVNLEPENMSFLKNQNEHYQNMQIQKSNSSQNLRDELMKKAKYIQELNREIQKQKIRYDSLNQSYQAFKQQKYQSTRFVYMGEKKTVEELINELKFRDQLIINKTDRIYQLQEEIKQLKEFIQKLKSENQQLRQYLKNGNYKQVDMKEFYGKVQEINKQNSQSSLNKELVNNTFLGSLQKQKFNQNKQKKSLFNQEAVVSQNIVQYQSDKKFANISKSSSNHPIQANNSSKRQSIINANLLKSNQEFQTLNNKQKSSLKFVKSNNSIQRQIKQHRNNTQKSLQDNDIPIQLAYQKSESFSLKFQQERIQNNAVFVSNNDIQNNKKIVSSIFDKAKSLDEEVNHYWERVSEMHNKTIDQYEQKMAELKKQCKILQIQKILSLKRYQEIKKQKVSEKIIYIQDSNKSQLLQNINSLSKQAQLSKQELEKIKIQLYLKQQQSRKQHQTFIQTIGKLQKDLQQEKTKKQLLLEQKDILISQKQNQYKMIEYQNMSLKEKLQQLSKQKIKEVTQYRISLSSKINEVQRQKEQSEKQTQELARKMKEEKQRLSSLQNEHKTIKYQYEKLNEKFQKMSKNSQIFIEQKQVRYKSLEQELAEAKRLIESLRKVIQQKQGIINKLNQQLAQYKDKLRQNQKNYKLQIETYQQKISVLQQQNQYLKSDNQKQNLNHLEEINYHKIEVIKLKNQIKQNSYVNLQLDSKLLNYKNQYYKIQQQNRDFGQKLNSVKGLLDRKNYQMSNIIQKQQLLSKENQRFKNEKAILNSQIHQKVSQFEFLKNGILQIFKQNAVISGNPQQLYIKMGLQLGSLLNLDLVSNFNENKINSQQYYQNQKQNISYLKQSQTSFARKSAYSNSINKNSINQSSFGEVRQVEFQQPQEIAIKSQIEEQIRNSQLYNKNESNDLKKVIIPNPSINNSKPNTRNTISIQRILSNPVQNKQSLVKNNSEKVILKRQQKINPVFPQNNVKVQTIMNDYGHQIIKNNVNNSKDNFPNRNKSAEQRNIQIFSNPVYKTPNSGSNQISTHIETNPTTSTNNQRHQSLFSPNNNLALQKGTIINSTSPFGFNHILTDNHQINQSSNIFSGIIINQDDYYGNNQNKEKEKEKSSQESQRLRISKPPLQNVVFNRTSQRKSSRIKMDQLSENNRNIASAKNRLSESQQSGLYLNQNDNRNGGCCMDI